MRFSSKSYKDKRKVEHPREECLVFEGTHPALVTQEVWDIVQRVRQNRRRPTKMTFPHSGQFPLLPADLPLDLSGLPAADVLRELPGV